MTHAPDTLDLETAPIGGLLLTYSMPAIAGMVVYSLYNIIDSIFIGHGVGPLAISGLAVTFPVMNLVFAVGLLVGIGGASVSSIRMGKKDMESAATVLGNVLVLSIINGFVLGALLLLLLDPILLAFGASAGTLPYARDFMQIILLGLPLTYVMSNLNQQMRSNGYPRKALVSLLVSVGVNVILAPLFIFVFHWGIRGAAIATVCAQSVALVWVLGHFLRQDSLLHFRPGIYKLKKSIVLSIFSIGLAPFLINAGACLVVAVINVQLREHGGDMAVGAYGIVNRILIFLIMIIIGLTQAMQPILGYNYGAQRLDRVRQTLKYGLIAGTVITSSGFVAAELFPVPIAALFTSDPMLTALAADGLRIATAAFPLVGAQIVLSNFFQSLGRARLAIFLTVSRQLLFLIPCLFIFPRYFGLDGIWASMPAADVLACFTTVGLAMLYLKKILAGSRSGAV